jgi:acetylornithine deacetylase
LVVRIAGPAGAPVLAFEAHMDTVGVTGMANPFAPSVVNGTVTGRGSCDTKGSLAAMMAAIEELAAGREALACTVELVAAVDEETSGAGARAHVASGQRADAAVIGEPTGCQVVFEHNGCVRGEVTVIGKAAHTSVAGEGINAIAGMAAVILALGAVNDHLAASPGGAAEHGSLTVSLIEGGTGINVVPERCTVNYDRRITPGQTAEGALAEIDAALAGVQAAQPAIRIVRPEPWLVGDALATPATHPVVRLAGPVNEGLGLDGAPVRVPYGSDASKFASAGIPALVYGPGSIDHAHSATEFVPVADLVAATAFYRDLALGFGRDA